MKHLIWISLLFFVSCKAVSGLDEEKTIIEIDGERVEMVSDEFGNQYLKQRTYGVHYVYIPFPFETEDLADTLHSYQAKTRIK